MSTSLAPPLDAAAPAEAASSPAKKKRGLMRYAADVRSLAWVQVTLAIALIPFLFDMPLWLQVLWGVPTVFFRTKIAYVQHNQGHLQVFWNPILNFLYDMQIALVSGYVTPLWENQHSRGHHRHYLTPELDPARIIDLQTKRPMSRIRYCVVGNLTIIRDAWRIGGEEAREGRTDQRPKLALQLVVATVLATGLLLWNPWSFFWFILLPNLLVAWGVWHVSYDHHYELPTKTHFDASFSELGHAANRLTFNIGHHAAHHEKPTLHWSLLPKRSAQILHKLDPQTLKGSLEPEMEQFRVKADAPANAA